MAKTISASNAVVNAVEAAASLYGVRCYRMNSRTFTVAGAGGRDRPMFMGQWRDEFGTLYRKGMADLLLTPRIIINQPPSLIHVPMNTPAGAQSKPFAACVPLWVECKSGSGVLTVEQRAFREDVRKAGAFYIEAHDSADEVIVWFEAMQVRK
jgi:hypothetical protein